MGKHVVTFTTAKLKEKYIFTYSALFWLFMFGSVAGFVIEGIFCILKKGYWENHTATVWGPFCIIYGIGAVVVYLLSVLVRNKKISIQIIIYSVAGALVEYISSLFQEACFGSISWNYSKHFMNIGGRVSLQMALLWGVLGVLFVHYVFPAVSKLLKNMNSKRWKLSCIVGTVFMVVNLLVTCAAVYRWSERQNSNEIATTVIEQRIDDAFNDEVMTMLFPNMVFRGE